jgi:hypothetical protein
MLAWSIWLLRADLLALPAEAHYVLIAAAYTPLAGGLMTGQDHCLFLLLWVLAYRSLRESHEYRAGVFIGLALIRFQFAGPVLLILLARRLWKVVLPVAVIAVCGLVLSRALVGPNLFHDYRACIAYLSQWHDKAQMLNMPTIRGFLGYLGVHNITAIAAADAAALLWAAGAAKKMAPANCLLFAMFLGILADYHCFIYELVVLVMPFAALLRVSSKAAVAPILLFAVFLVARNVSLDMYAFACPILLGAAVLYSMKVCAAAPSEEKGEAMAT